MRTMKCEQSSEERVLKEETVEVETKRGLMESYRKPPELDKSINSDPCSNRATMMTWIWLMIAFT